MSATFSRTAEVSLIYKLEGQVEDVDVFQLAPALLSLGELIRETNRTLNRDNEELSIRIKPFAPGSFTVDLGLAAHLAAGVFPFVTVDRIKRVKEVFDALKAAVEVIKTFGGKKPEFRQIAPGEFRYYSDNITLNVNGPVHNLIQSPTIVEHTEKAFARPATQNEEVMSIRSFLKGSEDVPLIVTKDDARAIEAFAEPLALPPAEIAESNIRTFLNPRSGPYGDKGARFWFTRGDETFTASIEAKDFLNRVERGEIRLHHTDVLEVEMAVTEKVEAGKVSVSRRILKVLDYRPGSLVSS